MMPEIFLQLIMEEKQLWTVLYL